MKDGTTEVVAPAAQVPDHTCSSPTPVRTCESCGAPIVDDPAPTAATELIDDAPAGDSRPAEARAGAPQPSSPPSHSAQPSDAQATVPQVARLEQVTVPLVPRTAESAAAAEAQARIQYSAGTAPVKPRVPPAHDPWAGPTLTDIGQAPYDLPPGAAVHRPRRRGWLAIVVAVLLVGAGSLAYVHLRSSASKTPAQAVKQYFADLGNGDITAAMKLVVDPGSYTTFANPLLSATALAQPATRPGSVAIGDSVPTTVSGGQSATAVAVSYAVGGTTVHQTITVVATSSQADTAGSTTASKQPFLLEAPFIKVTVDATSGRSVTVNGLPYPSGSAHPLAFPGAYSAKIAGNQLIAGASVAAVYDDSDPTAVTANIAPPAPAVASGATAAVQAAVNKALKACASSTSATPDNCPFSYSDSSATVAWKIVTYPTVSVQIGGDGTATFDDGDHAATVHYDAQTTDWIGFSETDSNDATVNIDGTASVGTSGIAVKFN